MTSASESALLPPFGGIAFLPLRADWCSVSIPCFRRGAQASLSPAFGAPAIPAPWHTEHVCSNVALPDAAPPLVAEAAGAPLVAPAGGVAAAALGMAPPGAAAT